MNVGERNVEFVTRFLAAERIPLIAKDVLDVFPRKVCLFPKSGRALCKRLPATHGALFEVEESRYRRQAAREASGGDIELFLTRMTTSERAMKTKVLIVDDSALVRSLMTEIINRAPDLEAIGAASDPYVAREMIRTLNPDVLTLDIEMPKMDGLEFLEKIMRLRPMPVVMVSTLTERGADGDNASA